MDCACWEDCCSQRGLWTFRIATVASILLRSRASLTAQTFMPGWSEFARSCGLAPILILEILIPAPASRLGSRLAAACSLQCWQRPYLCGTASAACRRQQAHLQGHRSNT